MNNKKLLQQISLIIMIMGSLLYGVLGLFGINLLEVLFQGLNLITRVIYSLIAVAGIMFVILKILEKSDN